MHAKIRAHPVPGAVIIILPRRPQRLPRQRIQITPRQPFGPAHARDRDHALQHPRERGAFIISDLANSHRARNIRGAVDILAATVDQQQLPRLNPAVGRLVHPVMHNRPVRPRSADGFKADVQQRIGGAPKPLQFLHHVNFAQVALGRRFIQPRQKLDHGAGIAQMRRDRSGDFGFVLARLGQDAGVLTIGYFDPRRVENFRYFQRRRGFIHAHRPGQLRQRRQERVRPCQCDVRAQMRRQSSALFGVHEQAGLGVVAQDQKAMRHRHPGNVAAPDVQQPGNRVRQGDNRRRLLCRAQACGQTLAFVST